MDKDTRNRMAEGVVREYISGRTNKSELGRHFGISRKTVYRIIKKYEEDQIVGDRQQKKVGKSVCTPRNIAKVVRICNQTTGVSDNKLKAKIKCSRRSIQRMREVAGIKTYRRQRAPRRTPNQTIKA